MLPYDMPLYRPPSEGNNLIVQATYGCSFNRCSFCSMYKGKEFTARPLEDVFRHIEFLVGHWPDADRVFLADGDAMCLPVETLEAICDKLAQELPNLTRITAYASPRDLARKSLQDLERLRARKLTQVYVGVESGSPEVLSRAVKGVSPNAVVTGINKAMDAGMKVSATVILGLGGQKYSAEHVQGTADVINRAAPTYLSTLQLALEADVYDGFMKSWKGDFAFLDDAAILEEMRCLLTQLEPKRPVIFRSNHASNALPLAGTLPKDTARLIAQIENAQKGAAALRPEWMRGF
ncbi:MAG: radical SAM protein [Rhodospirillaceae bacterium]|nr:radical SAM protein [Rhodospirillaceae bacterium]